MLDAAQSGAMVENLVTHELDYLISSIKSNSAINLTEDWKLLTILIGANDLCASCTFAKEYLSPGTYFFLLSYFFLLIKIGNVDEFETHLSNVLEGVRKNIPRVFVQLVEIFNISQVYHHAKEN